MADSVRALVSLSEELEVVEIVVELENVCSNCKAGNGGGAAMLGAGAFGSHDGGGRVGGCPARFACCIALTQSMLSCRTCLKQWRQPCNIWTNCSAYCNRRSVFNVCWERPSLEYRSLRSMRSFFISRSQEYSS